MDQTERGISTIEFSSFINKLKLKDTQTWNEFDFVIRRVLLKWIARKGLDSYQVEEVYHESIALFLEKFEKLHFDSLAGIKSYLFSIADNKVKEFWRRDKREKRNLPVEDITKPSYVHYLTVAETKDYKEDVQQIKRIMTSLNRQEQCALELCYQHELPLEKVAEIMKISNGNVRVIKSRAIKKIREKLFKQNSGNAK